MSEVLRLIKEAAAQKAAQEKPKGLRVAAYCRVSTDSDEQKTSYRTQKAFYTDMIQRHPGWTFAGIYADEGITGTSRLHRDEFNQMLEDARNGKIDLIVTKSISRFARNTVDTLDCARQLKQLTPPVGIFFEKENINTLDSTSEVILTIYSALAQEESHSISDNIHWSYQKRFQEGKPMVHLSRMIGYDKGENGEWIINEEQAEPVRYLFRRYACGAGRATIINEMNERGWKTVSGTDWNPSSFSNVILNEKYVGDLEMQKYVTSNFLSHKAVPNRGQLPKYYIRDHHAPIVDRATWLIVQSEMKRRPPLLSRDPLNICYVNLSCPACGKTMVHKRRKIAAYWVDAESIEDTKERQNIDTLDATGELILTILSALAQDESRSISDNIRWSIQKNFQAGKPKIDLNRMLGYDKGENGEWVINPEQAKTVRYIFERYVCGQTANRIAKELNELGRKTVNKKNWSASSVLTVLRNEKYVGDIEMQKTITKDFLTHRSTINKGEAPRYYVENHHVGIIDRSTWDKAQTMLYEKPSKVGDSVPAQKKKRGYTGSPFGNLVCGAVLEHGERAGKECGEGFFRVTYTGVATGYTDDRSLAATGGDTDIYLEKYAYAYPVWRCKQKMGKREGEKLRQNGTPDQKLYCREKHGRLSDAERKAANERCPSETIHECALEQSFMEMLYRLKRDYEKNHEASEISTLFHKACEQMYQQMKGNSVSVERLETLDAQIKELEEKLQETIGRQVTAMRDAVLEQNLELNESLAEGNITLDEIDSDIRNGLTGNDIGTSFYHADYEEGSEIEAYASLAKDIRQRIESFRKEKETLSQEQGALTVMKKNFDLFIACLKELPEQNAAGMPLKVNGLDVQGSLFRDVDGKPVDGAVASLKRGRLKITPERIAEAPDLLHFEKGIYCAFMKKGTVKGDIVLYETNFGVTLPTCGNQRTLTSFLGFKKCSLDGLVMLVDAPYRVYDNTVQYRRYLRSKAKREQAV